MGHRLADYVLPKVPVDLLLACRGRALVRGGTDLGLANGVKREGKLFNWRRPHFAAKEGTLQCFVAPGRDYVYHYGGLIATACHLLRVPASVELELPTHDDPIEFMRRWLPATLPRVDIVVLGYVQRILMSHRQPWMCESGFGWASLDLPVNVALVGCEFSFWGDLAGALVSVLADRGTKHVIYVGKLGSLDAACGPNQYVATGTSSLVEGRLITWATNLDLAIMPEPGVLSAQAHITVPSTLDETTAWYAEHKGSVHVVDPEIGRMAVAAIDAGICFDYIHIISDNLSGQYAHGLYDERSAVITTDRQQCLARIDRI